MGAAIQARGTQLITYPDSLGGDLVALDRLLSEELVGLFPAGIHVLPPFPSSGDRGFAPLGYREVDPAFGTWRDLARIARHGGLTVDVMVNHISRHSLQFADFERRGRASEWADAFITLDKVWPAGEPVPEDVQRVFLRKPQHPFSDIAIAETGAVERIWTSFGPRADWSEQIDLDVRSPVTWRLFEDWFTTFADNGVTTVRLDAVGYVVKRAGTSCFMVEPDIWEFLERISALADGLGLELLPEVHDRRSTFEAITGRGYTTYNFALPGLILDAVLTGEATHLVDELAACPANQVTMLDCHDGIPVQPDLVGILPRDRMEALVRRCLDVGGNVNRILGTHADTFDAHQLNVTYPDACGSDSAYLLARAIQLFAPGRPQVYYVGLLAGAGDHEAVARTGEGRAINRHDYSADEIRLALERPVVQQVLDLIRLRNAHPAFAGDVQISSCDQGALTMEWRAEGASCRLDADLATSSFSIFAT